MINYGATIRKNPNTIPNGVLIGGVANFFTSTKPIARVDGTALVVGDLWVNASTGVQGFWNGTYWLSSELLYLTRWRNVINSASLVFPVTVELDGVNMPLDSLVFIETVDYAVSILSAGDIDNFRSFQILRRSSTGSNSTIYTSTAKLFNSTQRTRVFAEAVNIALLTPPLAGTEWVGFTFNFSATGTVINGSNPAATLRYRLIL